jgi:hypothetical protein
MLFGHIGGLYPVLDATFVSQAGVYYVYNFFDGRLMKAGGTLEEVFNGMKERRHQAFPENGGWDDEDFEAEDEEVDLYFPSYKPHPVHGYFILEKQIPELPLSIE